MSAGSGSFFVPPRPEGLKPGPPPSFSVLIPLYNSASTVAEAVESALGQTRSPAEVIVCDDGSTDGPNRALAHLSDEIVLLRQDRNRGPSVAKNAGLALAEGQFVVVLDADDVWDPRRLECLGCLGAERPDLDILGSDLCFEDDGRITGRFSDFNPFPETDQDLAILERCFLSNPALRRERVQLLGGFDPWLRLAEDWDILLRLILDGARAGFVDEPLARYRRHGESLTAVPVRRLRHRVLCLRKAALYAELSEAQREVLQRSIAYQAGRARRAELLSLVRARAPGVRRQLLAYSMGYSTARGVPLRERVRAGLASIAPRPIQRRLIS